MKLTTRKALCYYAASQWYTSGQVYDIYQDGEDLYVKASDGLYDNIRKCKSKFEELESEATKQKSKRSKLTAVGKGSNSQETPKP